jgi:hypothetical protein
MQALERISKAPALEQATVFVMKDIGTLIAPGANGQIASNQLAIIRELKNLAWQIARDRRCLVILSDQLRLPQELRQETTVVDLSLPGIEEISHLLDRLVEIQDLKLNGEQRQQFVKACQGLTRCRISRVLAKCLVRGKVDNTALAAVIEEKRQTIRETGILEFIPLQSGLGSCWRTRNSQASNPERAPSPIKPVNMDCPTRKVPYSPAFRGLVNHYLPRRSLLNGNSPCCASMLGVYSVAWLVKVRTASDR